MSSCLQEMKEQPLLALSRSEESSEMQKEADAQSTASAGASSSTLHCEERNSSGVQSASTNQEAFGSIGLLLRVLLMDAPLMIILGTCMCLVWVDYVHDNYLVRQIEAAEWTDERAQNEMTYYTRPCNKEDMSTFNKEELFLPDDATAKDAYEHQLLHGFTVFPDVLSEETATNLRRHIDSRNHNLTEAESNFVIAKKNRYSYNLGTEEPVVAQAMMELTTNERLKDSVEMILGKNPALIEMTAITSSYGAVDQYWHDDVVPDGSAIQYARAFGPSYSIFVMLQNTTKSMGATAACPGSHMCAAGPRKQTCEQNGFQLVGKHGYWKTGDALLMNMNSWHRGAAHTDPNAPDRVMLILTFVPLPRSRAESRQMSQGITFSLRWDMWGHTWNDLSRAATAMRQPWVTLRALGLYKKPSADWGIDYVSGSSMRIANEDNGFRRDELIDFVHLHGGFKFLPKWLHGEVGDDEETSWHEFLLDTLHRCERFVIRVGAGTVGAYVLFYILIGIVMIGLKGDAKGAGHRFGRALLRLGIMVSLVFVLYYAAIKHIDSTQWASDLRQGLRYTSPFGKEETLFDGPTAFPYRKDVLLETRFKSSYLAMYNDYVANHPGNRVYNELIDEKASIFESYSGLPSSFKVAVADFVIGALRNDGGRFLYQNAEGDFVLISNQDAVAYTMQELATKSNAILSKVVRELKFLNSEAKYGPLRESTMMSKRHMLSFLLSLQSRLLIGTYLSSAAVKPQEGNQHRRPYSQGFRTIPTPTFRARSKIAPRHPAFLNVDKTKESPFAHLQAGRIVDTKYMEEDGVTRWYKGQVDHVWSTGEVKVSYFGTNEYDTYLVTKIREYIAPKVGEIVEVEIRGEWKECHIVEAEDNGRYDVVTDGERGVLENIRDDMFRRK